MRIAFILIFIFALVASIFLLYLPLEWGLMDDSEYVNSIHFFFDRYSWFEAMRLRVLEHSTVDFKAGIMRPSFWLYTATIYQLPVTLAYFVRLFFYLVILILGVSFLRSSSTKQVSGLFYLFAVFCFFSIRSLYDGIALISLQEFSGLFFIIIGYAIYFFPENEKVSTTRLFISILLLLIGVGFKPPYVWVLFFFSIGLWFSDKRKIEALALFLFACFFLWFSAELAKKGFYSQEIYRFEVSRVLKTILYSFQHFFPVLLVFISGFMFSFQVKLKKISFESLLTNRSRYIGLQIFFSGIMYLFTLLPRGIGVGYGYYFCPPIALIVLGILLIYSNLTAQIVFKKTRLGLSGMLFSAFVALFLCVYSNNSFVNRTIAIDAFKRWAISNNIESTVLYTNSYEVAIRLKEIFRIRTGEEFKGKILSLIEATKNIPSSGYYLVFSDQVEPKKNSMVNLLWQRGSASLYRIEKN
ncbi:MAG: hypothetical protein M9962_13480 [Oligoflexia bacterium]|nr:hypothetical protein [Oligoflexia bacterium]